MAILLASSDLAIISLVTGAAKEQPVEVQTASSPGAVTSALASRPFRLVIFDLGMPGLDVTQAMAGVRSQNPAAQAIAFGPHVQEGLLTAAREAGCDRVLSRGQFHAQINAIIGGAGEGSG